MQGHWLNLSKLVNLVIHPYSFSHTVLLPSYLLRMPLYCCAGGGGPPSKDVFALWERHTVLQAMYVLLALQPGWPKWDPDLARAEKVEGVRQID